MPKTLILIIIALVAVPVVGGYQDSQKQLAASKVQWVQTICDQAHGENSGQSEEACGQAQDQTNTEYLCGGYSPDSTCWVEVK